MAGRHEIESNKGQANGYAPLDSTSKVPEANLPDIGSGVDEEVLDADGKRTKTDVIAEIPTDTDYQSPTTAEASSAKATTTTSIANSEVTDDSHYSINDSDTLRAASFIAGESVSSGGYVQVNVRVHRVGSPPNDLRVDIYNDDTNGDPNISIGHGFIPNDINTVNEVHKTLITLSESMMGTDTFFVVLSSVGVNSPNTYRWRREDLGSVGNAFYSFNSGSTWTAATANMWFSVEEATIIHPATLAVDNDTATYWEPFNPDEAGAWLYADMGSDKRLNALRIYWPSDAAYRPTAYTISTNIAGGTLTDPGDWTDRVTLSTDPGAGWTEYLLNDGLKVRARYLRIKIATHGSTGTRIHEVENAPEASIWTHGHVNKEV